MIERGANTLMSYTLDRPATPPPTRTKTKTTAIAVTILAVLCAGAVVTGAALLLRSGDTTPPAASTPTTGQTPAAQATPATCPNGRLANGDCAGGTSAVPKLANDTMAPIVCPAILKAMGTQAIYDPDQMEPIGEQAGTSLDRDLAFAGLMLGDTARSARSAKKNNFPAQDQARAVISLGTAATDLATVCTKGGFQQ